MNVVKKRFALITKKLLVRKSYVSCKKKSTMQFASSSIVSSIDFNFRVNNTNTSTSKMMQSIFTRFTIWDVISLVSENGTFCFHFSIMTLKKVQKY